MNVKLNCKAGHNKDSMLLNNKKMALILTSAIFFIALDRFLKVLAKNYFFNKKISLIGDILKFNFAKNYGIAFSIPFSGFILNLIIIIIILMLGYILFYSFNKKNYLLAGLLTIIVFGAISNMLDRAMYGFVIDYIDLKYFTIFNIADIMIVLGALFLLILNKRIKN
ncbi:signal peptidase II [Candidatus Falkowbacteria bacterium]|nr:MAG: signal peptidase II [Candidatus Falkowbacteria bacterium]